MWSVCGRHSGGLRILTGVALAIGMLELTDMVKQSDRSAAMKDWAESIGQALGSEASAHGFSVHSLAATEDGYRWGIGATGREVGTVESNGEVYDLEVPGGWHFYFFEYDESREVIEDLFLVLAANSSGNYQVKRGVLGGQSVVVAVGDTQWGGTRRRS